jgi:predicted nucleic acid-binding protein
LKAYLLDTNVASELRKRKPHGGVLVWLKALPPDRIYLSAVTFGELQAGVQRTRRQDPSKAAEIEGWSYELEETMQVIPMDVRCFREHARLMEGTAPTLSFDAMIAATARVHNLIVATRNVRDFRGFDVTVFNPFDHGG